MYGMKSTKTVCWIQTEASSLNLMICFVYNANVVSWKQVKDSSLEQRPRAPVRFHVDVRADAGEGALHASGSVTIPT